MGEKEKNDLSYWTSSGGLFKQDKERMTIAAY